MPWDLKNWHPAAEADDALLTLAMRALALVLLGAVAFDFALLFYMVAA